MKRFEKIAFFEGYRLVSLNFIFVRDRTILCMNSKYLSHNYPTDIITFDYTSGTLISGDIYISFDTVYFNSQKFNTGLRNELHRVMIHGLLHLLGYKDKSSRQKSIMRKKEDYYLRLLS